MRMSEKCRNKNNNSDNPLTSRRTDGGKNIPFLSGFDGLSKRSGTLIMLNPAKRKLANFIRFFLCFSIIANSPTSYFRLRSRSRSGFFSVILGFYFEPLSTCPSMTLMAHCVRTAWYPTFQFLLLKLAFLRFDCERCKVLKRRRTDGRTDE